MMRSMYSGVSGLRVHQTKMDVIANNISNVNTVGFKSSRATFQEVFNQTLTSASKAAEDGSRGGTNPSQIGLGVSLGSIDLIMTRGVPQRTDWAYDLMIDGEGFFVVSDSTGQYFTRAGDFRFDLEGNLTNSSGMFVNGWGAMDDPNEPGQQIINKGQVGKITITARDEYIDASETTYIRASGNLNASREPEVETTTYFYDTLGNSYTLRMRYQYDDDPTSATYKQWKVQVGNQLMINNDPEQVVYIDTAALTTAVGGLTDVEYTEIAGDNPFGIAGTPPTGLPLTILDTTSTPSPEFGWTDVSTIYFDKKGNLFREPVAGAINPDTSFATSSMTSLLFTIDVGDPSLLSPNAGFKDPIVLNFEDVLQQNGASTFSIQTKDGNTPGSLQRLSISPDGMVAGAYSNGETKILAQIALATFKNPAGLEKVGNNLFAQTRNSGEFDGIGLEATSIGSTILSGVLEMANVDLASEFTEMITTQRGFQANSRIITTSDDMLQELVNLKR